MRFTDSPTAKLLGYTKGAFGQVVDGASGAASTLAGAFSSFVPGVVGVGPHSEKAQ